MRVSGLAANPQEHQVVKSGGQAVHALWVLLKKIKVKIGQRRWNSSISN